MSPEQIYNNAITILDNFLEESNDVIDKLPKQEVWRNKLILKLYKQSCHIMYALLSNSESSRFRNETYVSEIILVGALGRIIRDIYVNIIYLKTNVHPEELMTVCWDLQTVSQKINLTEFENPNQEIKDKLVEERKNLLQKLEHLNYKTKSQVLKGRDEKLLSLKELSDLKGFHYEKFYNEFAFFSQFSHSTAFGNHFIKDNGIPLDILTVTYDRLTAYFVGIVTESLDLLFPEHRHMTHLRNQYILIIKNRWNLKQPSI